MPTKPKSKPEPVEDTDDSAPDLVTVEFNGYSFTIPRAADDWTTIAELARIRALTIRTPEAWLEFIQELVGPQQWETVITAAAPKRAALYEFVGRLCNAVQEECII